MKVSSEAGMSSTPMTGGTQRGTHTTANICNTNINLQVFSSSQQLGPSSTTGAAAARQQDVNEYAATSRDAASLSSSSQALMRGCTVPESPPYEPYSPAYEPDSSDTSPEDPATQDYTEQERNIFASQISIAQEFDIQWIQVRAGTHPLYQNIVSGAHQDEQPDRFVPMGYAVEHEDNYEQRLQGLLKPQLDLFIPHTLELQDLEKLSSQESPRCPVCFEEYEVGQAVWYLPCLHRMHQRCIQPWLEKNHV